MIVAFWSSTMLNGADWIAHPLNSTAIIRLPFGTINFKAGEIPHDVRRCDEFEYCGSIVLA